MSILDDIKAHLAATPAVMTLATGGITLDVPDPRATPRLFDPTTGRIKPLVYLWLSSMPRMGPYTTSAWAYINIRCYAPTGRQADALDAAVFAALHEAAVPASVEVRWIESFGFTMDQTYSPPEPYVPSRWRAPIFRG
jgi:hypothetical protein